MVSKLHLFDNIKNISSGYKLTSFVTNAYYLELHVLFHDMMIQKNASKYKGNIILKSKNRYYKLVGVSFKSKISE